MNRLNEKKLGTAPDNPGMGDINDITASTQEKTKSDTEKFQKFYGTYHKSVAADPVLHLTLPRQIYFAHTLLIAKIQTQRECALFIRGFSNWAFSTSLTERQKQTIWCPVACKTVAAGFRGNLIWKANMLWNLEPMGTILVNSSIEHYYYHHQKPAPLAPNFDSDCGQLRRRQTEACN